MTILDDSTFFAYIGTQTITGTAAQRDMAYRYAEDVAQRYVGTLFGVQTITGTFNWPSDFRLTLPYGRVSSVELLWCVYRHKNEPQKEVIATGVARLVDENNGHLLLYAPSNPPAKAFSAIPDLARVVYRAGIDLGVLTGDVSFTMALCLLAQEFLEQLVDPTLGEGGPGMPGVERISELGYTEQRMPMRRTILGSTARANMAARLLDRWRVSRSGKL